MKLSELRPCDCCGGKIVPQFYIVRTSLVLCDAQKMNTNLGMTQMFGGALGLAEIMSPTPEVATIAGEHDKKLWSEIFVCMDCYTMQEHNIAMLCEVASERKSQQEKSA